MRNIMESKMDKQVAAVLADVLGLRENQIIPELKKADVDQWDSLKQMDLINSLEQQFNVVLEIQDIVRMDSVSNILTVLKERGVAVGD